MSDPQFSGGCHCGAVRYALAQAPSNSMLCHCRTCRHLSGAPVVAWITVACEAFAFVQGEPAVHVSSGPVRRTFCALCGTPLTYTHAGSAHLVDVTTCSLDAPDAWPPGYHAWTSHDLAWAATADHIPRFPGEEPGGVA